MRTETIVHHALRTLNDFFGPYALHLMDKLVLEHYSFTPTQIISPFGVLTHTGEVSFVGDDPNQFLMGLQDSCDLAIGNLGLDIPNRLRNIENTLWSRLENKIFILQTDSYLSLDEIKELEVRLLEVTPNVIRSCQQIVMIDNITTGPIIILGTARERLKYRSRFMAIIGRSSFSIHKSAFSIVKNEQPIDLLVDILKQEVAYEPA